MEFEQILEEIISVVSIYALDVLGAIIILIAGSIVSKWAAKSITVIMGKRPQIDPTVIGFVGSLTKFGILIITGLLVLAQFGVQTASLIAVLGAAGLAIGLAMQGTLSNVAGGVMLMFFRPMRVGNFVEVAGHSGTVKSIGLFTTELATPDNIQIIVPNGSIWGGSVTNYSAHATRRLDLVMGIGYEDDIDKAKQVIETVIKADERSLADPEPLVAVSELADSSVNFTIRIWCAAGDYFPLKFDLTRALKLEFDKQGINIPYPQQVVHLQKEAG